MNKLLAMWRKCSILRKNIRPNYVNEVTDGAPVVALSPSTMARGVSSVEEAVRGGEQLCVVCEQTQPDREPVGIDERLNLDREAPPRATETMISNSFIGPCWFARMEVLSMVWI